MLSESYNTYRWVPARLPYGDGNIEAQALLVNTGTAAKAWVFPSALFWGTLYGDSWAYIIKGMMSGTAETESMAKLKAIHYLANEGPPPSSERDYILKQPAMEAYAGFDADYLNSKQPVPAKHATVYRTLHQPWAIESARMMRDRFGINVWVDGTVTTGWRVLVHAGDGDRARRMFLATLGSGKKLGFIPGMSS